MEEADMFSFRRFRLLAVSSALGLIWTLGHAASPNAPTSAAATNGFPTVKPTDSRPEKLEGAKVGPLTDGIGWGITDRFEVLDLNIAGGVAAIKLVYHEPRYDPDLNKEIPEINCNYAGMQAHPTSAVTLAFVELHSGTVHPFHVYPLAYSPKGCASHEQSAATLAKAKKVFEKVGLNITRKPQPVAAEPDGSFTVKVGGNPVGITAWTVTSVSPSDALGETETGISIAGKPRYIERREFELGYAAHVDLTFPGIWVQDKQAVFVVRTTHSNKTTAWRLSAPVNLN
jgi:hypothetical protein